MTYKDFILLTSNDDLLLKWLLANSKRCPEVAVPPVALMHVVRAATKHTGRDIELEDGNIVHCDCADCNYVRTVVHNIAPAIRQSFSTGMTPEIQSQWERVMTERARLEEEIPDAITEHMRDMGMHVGDDL